MEIDRFSKAGIKLLKKFGERASCSNCTHCNMVPMKFAVCTKTAHCMVDPGKWICSIWDLYGDPEIWNDRKDNGK